MVPRGRGGNRMPEQGVPEGIVSREDYMFSLVVIRAHDIDRLASFYGALGFSFTKHRHGKGPEHFSSTIGETVFEIYPSNGANESTVSTRLGFILPSLTDALGQLRGL